VSVNLTDTNASYFSAAKLAPMCGFVETGGFGGGERDQSHKMLLTYLFYIDLLRYSHRESTRRTPS
jgi:hypothetical protein